MVDQNPLNQIHSQPPPARATLNPAGQWQWDTALVITNTLNQQSSGSQSIYLDYESYYLHLAASYAVTDKLTISMAMPLIYRSGGVFDASIENWHRLFNLPQGNRPTVADNQYTINYQTGINGKATLHLTETSSGIGDLQMTLARQIVGQLPSSSTHLTTLASISLPTGKTNTLNGNGAVDVALWLAADHRFMQDGPMKDSYINANLGLNFPALVDSGNNALLNDQLNDEVIFGNLMLGWRLLHWLDVKLQFDGHSAYYKDTSLRLLGSSYTATFGGTFHFSKCQNLDIAFTEDFKVEAAPDISLIVRWQALSGC